MTKRKGIRTLAALALCFTLCISFTVPAFAYADDTEQELPVTEATQPEATPETAAPEEPEPYEGEPIDGEGNAYTRDPVSYTHLDVYKRQVLRFECTVQQHDHGGQKAAQKP